jgi:hypothetical protein
MKKFLIPSIALFLAMTSVACKKDYNCKCQKIYTGSSGSAVVDDGVYTYKDTKSRAEDRCQDQETTGSDIGGDYTRECEIQ